MKLSLQKEVMYLQIVNHKLKQHQIREQFGLNITQAFHAFKNAKSTLMKIRLTPEREAMYKDIIKNKLTIKQVQAKYGMNNYNSRHACENAMINLMEVVPESKLEKEAVERVKAWQAQGSPKDNLGRIPVELLGDYRIAQKHLGK